MNTQELKEQDREELISEIIKILSWQQVITNQGYSYDGEKDWALNKILSLIDKTVQMTEERVVGLIRKATTYDHSKCPIKETCIGYQSCVSDIENSVIASLITNKSDTNKEVSLHSEKDVNKLNNINKQ